MSFMDGGKGNDSLWGGPGLDTVNGDAGHDMIYVNFEEMGQTTDTVDGGDGNDTVSFEKWVDEEDDTPVILDLSTSNVITNVENIIGSARG